MFWADRFCGYRPIGSIFWDHSSKGNGRHHECWRAELQRGGLRIRKRSNNYHDCEIFLFQFIKLHSSLWPEKSYQCLKDSFYE